MIKTLKHIRLNTLLVSSMFLLLCNAQAQSIIFSSDQWPKRWERAMQKRPMNGNVIPARFQRDSNYSREKTNGFNTVRHQGWGQQPEQTRHKRSRTPEYRNGLHNKYVEDPLKQRYALPESRPNSSGYGRYPAIGYYGNTIPAYSYIPATIYPGMGYPNVGYPGVGNPGMGYPGRGYPGMGYPGMGYPGMGYPGMGYPGMGYPW